MYYVNMRPSQIKDAVERNVPVLIAAGAVEYHGPHLPLGTDFLIAEAVIKGAEERCECVIFPPLPFSPTMFWAGGSEDGEIDFDADALSIYTKEMLKGIVKIGFKRIYILQHHAGGDASPALAVKRAARSIIDDICRSMGSGWGRLEYKDMPDKNIFDLITIAGLDSFSKYKSLEIQRIPIGHAGMGETQLMMANYPEFVKMDELEKIKNDLPRFLKDSHLASAEEGKRWTEFCVDGWVNELNKR